ncbi:MAG: hypothetical protein V1926_03475 [Candidatus Peregrinibacteria bacterium]
MAQWQGTLDGGGTLTVIAHLSPLDDCLCRPLRDLQPIVEGLRQALQRVMARKGWTEALLTTHGPGKYWRPAIEEQPDMGPRDGLIGYILHNGEQSTVLEYAHRYSTLSGRIGEVIQRCAPESVISTYRTGLRRALAQWDSTSES